MLQHFLNRSFFGGGPKPAAKAKRPLDSGSTADSQAKVASEDASGSEKAAPILASESAAKKKTKARKVIADSDSDGGEFDLETSEPSASKTEASKPRKATKSTPKAVATSPDKPEPKANEAAKKPTAGTLFSPKLKAKAGSSASSSAPTTLVAPSSSSSVSLPAAEGAEAEKAAACAAALAVVSKKETSPESAGKPVPYALLCDAFHEIEQITGRLQITATMTTLFAEVRGSSTENHWQVDSQIKLRVLHSLTPPLPLNSRTNRTGDCAKPRRLGAGTVPRVEPRGTPSRQRDSGHWGSADHQVHSANFRAHRKSSEGGLRRRRGFGHRGRKQPELPETAQLCG